ncbi:MAG: flagellar export chaperone FliS [Oscillospiraceae bacterium]|nr:flagellar export chaperone FliS [Oscillospiraceae bacterium]
MMNNAYQTYKSQSVMTMTQGQMLIMVYDELIKQLNMSLVAFDRKDIPEINRSLQKSQHVLNELKGTLNFDYSISENLNDIYNFFIRAIIEANVKKDSSGLGDILEMVTELRNVFLEADKLSRK